MTVGPGKYDDLATYVREQAGAHGVIVLVLGGSQGSGFSAQLSPLVPPAVVADLLRQMAEGIEDDNRALSGDDWASLDLTMPDGRRIAHIQRRPDYCDRGRFHANIEVGGFPVSDADPWPRYYFVLAHAKLEVLRYLGAKGVSFEGATWKPWRHTP